MVVVKIELWPHGNEQRKRMLGVIKITNDDTGTREVGNYNCEASHAGWFFGKRPEPYKTARVTGFPRIWSPYKLLAWCLRAMGER